LFSGIPKWPKYPPLKKKSIGAPYPIITFDRKADFGRKPLKIENQLFDEKIFDI